MTIHKRFSIGQLILCPCMDRQTHKGGILFDKIYNITSLGGYSEEYIISPYLEEKRHLSADSHQLNTLLSYNRYLPKQGFN